MSTESTNAANKGEEKKTPTRKKLVIKKKYVRKAEGATADADPALDSIGAVKGGSIGDGPDGNFISEADAKERGAEGTSDGINGVDQDAHYENSKEQNTDEEAEGDESGSEYNFSSQRYKAQDYIGISGFGGVSWCE